MRLTKQTGHAIRILIDCAGENEGLLKVADIANRLDITLQNAFKIVNILTHAGFIAATRGRNGGVRLAKPADLIRIGDVVRATETTEIEVRAEGGPPQDARSINSVLDDALLAFVSVLDQHTLADLARRPSKKEQASKAKPSLKTASRRSVAVKAGKRARASRGTRLNSAS